MHEVRGRPSDRLALRANRLLALLASALVLARLKDLVHRDVKNSGALIIALLVGMFRVADCHARSRDIEGTGQHQNGAARGRLRLVLLPRAALVLPLLILALAVAI